MWAKVIPKNFMGKVKLSGTFKNFYYKPKVAVNASIGGVQKSVSSDKTSSPDSYNALFPFREDSVKTKTAKSHHVINVSNTNVCAPQKRGTSSTQRSQTARG